MSGKKTGPKVIGLDGVMLPDDLRARVRTLVAAIGPTRARAVLRVGESTLQAACERGSLQKATVERIRAAIEAVS